MRKIIFMLLFIPVALQAQIVTQGICTRGANNTFTLNGISQSPYAGRFFSTVPVNLNSNFNLTFNAYLGNNFNNGIAFLFIPGSQPTTTSPPVVISTDNIHNFGTGSISNDFVIEFDIRGSFCVSGQNTSYEPTSDVNHVAYWRNNSPCNFANYYSPYSALGSVNYFAYEPYRIRWTKNTNTLEVYYNNVLIKSNIIDLVALLGANVYWGFSSGCYCVSGGPAVNNMFLNGARVLPLKLNDFTAQEKDGRVQLKWVTSQEQNTAHFEIERSSDGISFLKLQQLRAAGNNPGRLDYEAYDAEPFYGTNFYRLKMVDLDGQFTYSDIVAIKINATGSKALIFPNPAVKELHVQIPSTVQEMCTLRITDASGRLVKEKQVQLNNSRYSFTWDIQNLGSGIYWLTIDRRGGRETKKLVKR